MDSHALSAGPQSLVLLNTGDGKGKTTAALGVVVRALARGWRVGVIQFLKSDGWHTGEEAMLGGLGVKWLKAGGGFTWKDPDGDTSRALARAAWETAAAELTGGEFDLLVLDEITLPVSFGWLDEKKVMEAIRDRTPRMNVILTGRNAPASFLDLADTVTEMKSVRHAFDRGVLARAGLDY